MRQSVMVATHAGSILRLRKYRLLLRIFSQILKALCMLLHTPQTVAAVRWTQQASASSFRMLRTLQLLTSCSITNHVLMQASMAPTDWPPILCWRGSCLLRVLLYRPLSSRRLPKRRPVAPCSMPSARQTSQAQQEQSGELCTDSLPAPLPVFPFSFSWCRCAMIHHAISSADFSGRSGAVRCSAQARGIGMQHWSLLQAGPLQYQLQSMRHLK